MRMFSLSSSHPPPPLCSEQCRWCSVRPQILRNPGDQARENVLYSSLPLHSFSCTFMGFTYRSHFLGDESHDLHCFTHIMNICWCARIWTQTQTRAHTSTTFSYTRACTKELESRASAGNMQLCGYDVIDFLHWLEAAWCRAIRQRWKVPRCVEY